MISIKSKNLTQLILDLTITALFVFSSMFLLNYVLIAGPTAVFLSRSYKLVGLVFLILSIILIFYLIKNKDFT